jgi:hypothetical protein
MINSFNRFLRLGCAFLISAQGVFAQSAQEQGIASTTQILDTAVLFAIGAREAEQAIRGSFGWPTFQEGFVDRVYFRFDPDGYARFSTSPRLDEDVFEVICAESSTACIAKKPSLDIGLTVEGKIQIKVSGITPQDSFFVSDRKSELPLPPTVLEPLDARLETLLASGGHLVVKREVETVQEISLAGFSAVATYLRWVAQGQSPRVFPRGWPVPAQVQTQQTSGLTQPGAWITPNVGPQRTQTTFSQAVGQAGYQTQSTGGVFRAGQQPQVNYGANTGQLGILNNAQLQGGGLVVQPVGGMQQNLSGAQAAIQELQQELAQLRAAQGQPLTQVQDDFAKGFAQQAQARDLPTPVGYGANIETNQNFTPVDFGRNGLEAQVNQIPMVETVSTPSVGRELQAFEGRVYALEVAVNDLRRTVIAEIKAMKWAQNPGVQVDIPAPKLAEANVPSSEPASMDALEKLLLERLGKREVSVEPTLPVSAIAKIAGEETDRTLVMDLLRQLEKGQAPAVVAEPQEAIGQNSPVEEPQNGFVTLSDYINNMLKTENGSESTANQ